MYRYIDMYMYYEHKPATVQLGPQTRRDTRLLYIHIHIHTRAHIYICIYIYMRTYTYMKHQMYRYIDMYMYDKHKPATVQLGPQTRRDTRALLSCDISLGTFDDDAVISVYTHVKHDTPTIILGTFEDNTVIDVYVHVK